MRRLTVIGFILAMLVARESQACSDLKLPMEGTTSNVVSARTMDFSAQFSSQLAFVPRGTTFDWTWTRGKKWDTQYSFVGVNIFPWMFVPIIGWMDRRFCDGMNEHGLSAAILWLSTSQYPDNSDGGKSVFILDMVGWILGNYKNARDVYNAFSVDNPEAQPWFIKLGIDALKTPEHVVVHDANNESVVLEWINGSKKPSMWASWNTTNPYVGVMTNDPNYGKQTENLEDFKNKHSTISNVDPYDSRGYFKEGEGMLGLPGDHTPRSRFVRLNYLERYATPGAPTGSGISSDLWRVNQAFRVIGRADGVLGEMVHDDLFPYFFTLWTVVRDHTHRKFYYTGARNHHVKVVDINEIKEKTEFYILANVDEPQDKGKMAATDSASALYASISENGSQTTLAINTAIPEDSIGKSGNIFVYAVMNDGTVRSWNGQRWVVMKNGVLKPCFQGNLKNMTFNLAIENIGRTSWDGAIFHCGYGADVADMYLKGAYRVVYEMPTPSDAGK
jgi:choloylglycine hydrolase